MTSMLPIIPISTLQKSAKKVLSEVKDYAVVQSHGVDRGFILHPALGRLLLESGMLGTLRKMLETKETRTPGTTEANVERELRDLIGNVLRELSKR